jgi:uncharacterized protein
MQEASYELIKQEVLLKLEALSPSLTYHSIYHTLDVVEQAERIARQSGVSEREIFLLKVAGLFHDMGFLELYVGHEEKSCEYFLAKSAEYHFSMPDEQIITGIIMATKVPQQPLNLLEAIMCDADLDYLGRDDFFEIAENLKTELLNFGFIQDDAEWKQVQLKFLHFHHYHTAASSALREPVKHEHYKQLIG